MGANQASAKTVGALVDQTSNASGTTQSQFYTLNSVVLPANAFNANGRSIEIATWGVTAGNANAKDLKLTFGSTTLVTTTGSTANAKAYVAYGTVVRTGASTQSGFGELQIDTGTSPAIAQSAAIAETDTATITVAMQSQNTAAAAASATGNGMVVIFSN
jgi:hypothetical protein